MAAGHRRAGARRRPRRAARRPVARPTGWPRRGAARSAVRRAACRSWGPSQVAFHIRWLVAFPGCHRDKHAGSVTTRPPLSPTRRSTPQRSANRAVAERAALDEVLDAGLVCHLAVTIDGAPFVLPTGYGRDGDTL